MTSKAEKVVSEKTTQDIAELFKVLGDNTRIRILCVLQENEMQVCAIASALEMTQSAISHQLRVLKSARLVRCRRVGRAMVYSLADLHVKTIVDCAREHIEE